MKTQTIVLSGILVLAGGLCAVAQYAIDWQTVDGGGGTATGGVYAVSGTIGQPDAGAPMNGGQFSLTGGYWAMIAVQTGDAPYLAIVVSGASEATISWEPDDPGWVLQETSDLTAAWTNSPSGPTNPVVVPATLPTMFYRLHKP